MNDEKKEHTPRERNLLFAIISVRLNFVTDEALARATRELDPDGAYDLSLKLVEKGVISEEVRAIINPVVDAEIAERGGDVMATLASFGGSDSILESFGGYDPGEGSSTSLSWPGAQAAPPGPEDRDAAETVGRTRQAPERRAEPQEVKTHHAPTQQAQMGDYLAIIGKVTIEQPGRYTVKEEYGRGGIGRVLLAFDEHIGRDVALKELLGKTGTRLGTGTGASARAAEKAMVRFIREARITGQLEHPSIVPVYEMGQRSDGSVYYTMKLVKGKTLTDRIRESGEVKDRLMLLSHFQHLCQAMAYAHSKSVIHRDLKPQNVMVGEFGETVVLDWGLAKVKGQADERAEDLERGIELIKQAGAGETIAGSPLGTPAYMSPEQADGLIDKVDERSDVWSLGAVLYEILTGKPPFGGFTPYEVMGKVISEPVKPVREREPLAPPELAAICEKCLEKDAGQRYQSAEELAEDVTRFMAGGLVSAYEYSMGEMVKRWVKRRWPVMSTAAAALVVLFIVATWSYFSIREQRNLAVRMRLAAEKNESIAKEQRDLAEERKKEAERNLAEAYYQYGVRAENETRLGEARLYYAKALEMGSEAPVRDGLFREAVSKVRPILKRTFAGSGHRIEDVAFSPGADFLAHAGCAEGDLSCVLGEVRLCPMQKDKGSQAGKIPPAKKIGTLPPKGNAPGFDYAVETAGGERVFHGHEGTITAVDFSSDGSLMLTAGSDGLIVIWSPSGGAGALRVLAGHEGQVRSAAFLPGGKTLVSGGEDKTVRLWSAESGRETALLAGHSDMVLAVAASPDGGKVVSGGVDKTARVWSVSRKKELLKLGGHEDSVYSVGFSGDGKLAITGCADGAIRIFDASSGELVRSLEGHEGPVNSAVFSPDGRLVLSSGADRTMRLWLAETGELLRVFTAHSDEVAKVVFSSDSRLAAAAGWDGAATAWEMMDGPSPLVIEAHKGEVQAAAFSPDGETLATAGEDMLVKLWSRQGELKATLTGHQATVKAVDFSRNGKFLLSAGNDNLIKLWDAKTLVNLTTYRDHLDSVFSAVFSPDARLILSGGADRTLMTWPTDDVFSETTFYGHEGAVTSAAFAPDGSMAASGSEDKTVKLWDPATGEELMTLEGHLDAVRCVCFTPDSGTVISAGEDSFIKLWSAKTGKSLKTLIGHEGVVNSALASPSGKYVVSGGNDNAVKIWSISGGKCLLTMRGHDWPVRRAVYSPDGARIASAGSDKKVVIWTVEEGILEKDGEDLLAEAENETGLVLEGFDLITWRPDAAPRR